MKVNNIIEVQIEVDRFICRIEQLKEKQALVKGEYTYPSKETAALKRASMDLSRALSKMRQEYY
jgi:hypothetical protein